MRFLYTAPVYRIGDTITLNKRGLSHCYSQYQELFNLYGIPDIGFKNGRDLSGYTDCNFVIKYIVPHPTVCLPLYIVESIDSPSGVFIIDKEAIQECYSHDEDYADHTYENLFHFVENYHQLKLQYEKALTEMKNLERALEVYRPNPMPELKAGMFGKVYDNIEEEYQYFVVTIGDCGLIMVYEDGEFDEVEDFDAYGHACLSNDSVAARIITLYSPIVKSFRLAKQADENINFERNILWRAQLFTFTIKYGIIIIVNEKERF